MSRGIIWNRKSRYSTDFEDMTMYPLPLVNGILIQHGHFNTENLEAQGPKKKRSCRSFQYPISEGTADYIGSKRIGLTFEAFPSNPEKEILFADQEPNLSIISQIVVTATNTKLDRI